MERDGVRSSIKISTRLIFLYLVITIVFGVNIAIMISAFTNLERLSTSIINQGVSAIIDNSRISGRFFIILNETSVLLNTFYGDEENLQHRRELLLSDIEEILERESNELQQKKIIHFREALNVLLDHCRAMNVHADSISSIEKSFHNTLTTLETHISQAIISLVLAGDDSQTYEQLGALMPSYREAFLQISLLLGEVTPYFSQDGKVEVIKDKLANLHLRLRTLLASDAEVAIQGNRLLQTIESFQHTLGMMLKDSQKLNESSADLNAAKEQAVDAMSLMDQRALDTSQAILEKMNDITRSSLLKVIFLSCVFALFISILLFFFISRHIRRPMESIQRGINSVSQGDLSTVIEMGRHDEWSVLEKALNKMIADLRLSYAQLSENNAKLSTMNVEMERSMRQLEKEVQQREIVENSLQKSEERYRRFFEDDLSGAFITNSEGRFLTCNPSFLKMFRLDSTEEAMQLFIADLFPDSAAYNDFWSQLTSEQHMEQFEAELIRNDGTTIYAVSNVTVTFSGGDINEIKGYIIDETVRKEAEKRTLALEQQLRHSQKMEAIGTLAGGVAHDLNNILTGVVSYPDLLLPGMEEDNPYRKPIITMQESGKKAAAIVQDLLTLARRGVAMSEVCNINVIINDYLLTPEYQRMKSFYPDIEVKLELAEDLKNIKGSSYHLTKTIMNLVTNSAESIKDQGMITLRTENRDISPEGVEKNGGLQVGNYVILTVSDNGSGISRKHLDRIFEPFFTKKQMGRSGTGLGLAVVWGTVQDHNGHITVESDENRGTVFTLSFPTTDLKTEASAHNTENIYKKGNGEDVLIIDDNSTQREIVHEMLRELGYRPHAVASGEEAIDYLKENSVDLLLLDMIMAPGIDGLETYQAILRSKPDQKAIITSGYAETARVKEAQKAGAKIYLRKPFSLEALGAAIQDELST